MKQILLVAFIFLLGFSVLPGQTTLGQTNCLDFDGTDDYVDCTDLAAIDGASTLTIETWVNFDVLNTFNRLVMKEISGITTNGTGIQVLSSGEVVLFARNGSNATGTSGSIISTGTWAHIAFVFDGAGGSDADKLKCYVNGVAQSLTFTGTVPATLSSNSEILALGAGSNGSSALLNGRMDDVRIWSTARSASEIAANYNSELCGKESDLILYYNLNQGTAGGDNTSITQTIDGTNNSNNGTLTNFSLNTSSESNFLNSMAFEENGLNVDGTDDYVDCGDIAAIDGASALTIETWVNFDVLNAFNRLVMKEISGTSTNGTGIQVLSSGEVVLFARNGSNATGTSGSIISTGTWAHIAYVFDGSAGSNADKLKCYVNGVAQSLTFTGTIPATLSSNSEILALGAGSNGSSALLNGTLDDIRIWSTARSGAEILANYHVELQSTTSDLIAYYKFNQGTASGTNSSITQAKDLSVNCNHGTLTNMTLTTGSSSNFVTGAPEILPVELVDFRARLLGDNSQLNWQTASEINNQGFEIEWSRDNRTWGNIGFVNGSGVSYQLQSYQFTHERPVSGINYYRLKQIDFDGAFEYSNVVSVQLAVDSKRLAVYPNPIQNGSLTLYFPENEAETIEMTMYNYSGRLVRELNLANSQTVVNVSDLEKGIYLIQVDMDGLVSWERVVIQ